jgi:hypothetical protein
MINENHYRLPVGAGRTPAYPCDCSSLPGRAGAREHRAIRLSGAATLAQHSLIRAEQETGTHDAATPRRDRACSRLLRPGLLFLNLGQEVAQVVGYRPLGGPEGEHGDEQFSLEATEVTNPD